MTNLTFRDQTAAFKIGWIILMFLVVGNILSHIGLLFFDPNPGAGGDTVFLTWIAFNTVAAVILWVPYRRVEAWAWYGVWPVIAAYALIMLVNSDVGPFYLAEAAVMSLAQLLTRSDFFSAK